MLALWRYVWRERPRVVIATGHLSNLVAAGAAALPRPQGLRYYLNVQNDFVGSGKIKLEAKRRRKLRQIRWWYPWADGLLVTSKGLAENLVSASGMRGPPIHVIYSGVITERLLEYRAAVAPHRWLGADRDRPVIVGAGRLKEQKDFGTLIRAFAKLLWQREARLILLGEGEDRDRLERFAQEAGIAEAVDMPGFVANPYAWMARADVFALSSRWEGFGNVVAEALALGVPVVSTRCPSGPAEILGHGAYGRLVPVMDADAMADALIETLDNGNRCDDPVAASMQFRAEYAGCAYLEAFGLATSSADSPASVEAQ